MAEQLRLPVPGGIGTYVRGLVAGLVDLGPDAPPLTLWASRPAGRGPDPVAGLHPRACFSALPHRALVWAWDRGLAPLSAPAGVVHATSLSTPPSRSEHAGRPLRSGHAGRPLRSGHAGRPLRSGHAGRAGGRPMSVMVHDLAWRRNPEAFPARGRRWHEAALARALSRAAVLVVPSAVVAGDLVAAGAAARRVEVVEEGCDHLAAPDDGAATAVLDGLGVDGPFLLTVSTVEPRKNLSRLVAAYAVARPRLPGPWPLVVVGPAGWGPDVAAPPGSGVVAAGSVSPGVLSALYRRARVMAYVPLHEGFGLPPVEAMSVGTPVVASPVPSTGGAALEVDPLDTAAIADALVLAAADDRCRSELVAAGDRRAAGLTWAAAARGHVDLWESMVR